MAISAINALNTFAKDSIVAYIQLLVADGLVNEEAAMRKFSEMDFGSVAPKRRAPIAVPGSPSGYTDAYLNEVTGAVLRNIGLTHGITDIKQSGRQNKAEMVAIIKAHFAPAEGAAVAEAAEAAELPALEPPQEKKKEKEKEKPKKEKKVKDKEPEEEEPKEDKKPKKEKKEKKEKEKKEKKSESGSEDELREDPVPAAAKKRGKKAPEPPPEEEGIEAEMWDSPDGVSYLKDKDNNLYDKGTQELVGTWDEDAQEIVPVA